MELKDQVVEICKAAEQADLSGSGSIMDFESYLENLLDLLYENLQSNHAVVVDCLSSIGRREIDAPEETVEFCLHSLKLKEVVANLEHFHASLDKNSSRFVSYQIYLDKVKESLKPNWKYRDMFSRYMA